MLIVRIGLLTREYPPDVYGGAGVHVEHLVPALRALVDVDVHCFGEPRDNAYAHPVPADLTGANFALQTLGVNLAMVNALDGADVVHSHTWYANIAGYLAKMLYGVPHVVTAHSLEPRRPWKAEQLGGGYRLSSWVERTAYEAADAVIAVSDGMRADVLDCYPAWTRRGARRPQRHRHRLLPPRRGPRRGGGQRDRPRSAQRRVRRSDHPPEGRRAPHRGRPPDRPGRQLVLCAGAPDTPEIARRRRRPSPRCRRPARASCGCAGCCRPHRCGRCVGATVFVCPVGLRAAGHREPRGDGLRHRRRRIDVGGIPEVVDNGRTGLLVHFDENAVEEFRSGLAAAVNELLADPARAQAMGAAGRERAEREFAWETAATRTVEIYRSLV